MELLVNDFLNKRDNAKLKFAIIEATVKATPQIETIGQTINLNKKRFIDINDYIENCENCQKHIELLSPKIRKYSLTIFRLYFEHFMAKNWQKFSNESYDEYCEMLNKKLQEQFEELPFKAKRVTKKLVKQNLVNNLDTINGLTNYITQLQKHNTYNLLIKESINDLMNNYNTFQNLFMDLISSILKVNNTKQESLVFEMAS